MTKRATAKRSAALYPEDYTVNVQALDAAQISVEPDLFISMVASKLSKNLLIG
ncbi:MAG: hypothetical protein MR759_09375 [Ruminococcus sp.]|nr:hypothetical protein [Ruminococcus sp.]